LQELAITKSIAGFRNFWEEKMSKVLKSLLVGTALTCASAASAIELEVTHWWTSGGEAAAVTELAKAWDATGNTWLDGAIAGSGGVARPIIISRILGGDPMAATQLNHGRQAEELIEAGLMLDLTDIAEAGGWKDIVKPSGLLDACTLDGKIYCVPINIHSWQWLWLSNQAFADPQRIGKSLQRLQMHCVRLARCHLRWVPKVGSNRAHLA